MMTDRINNLPEEHIKIGEVIWYSGRTVGISWNCPAKIIEVNQEERSFKIKELDTLIDQPLAYSFDVNEESPDSRLSMRIPTKEEVRHHFRNIFDQKRQSIRVINKQLEAEVTKLMEYEQYYLDFALSRA